MAAPMRRIAGGEPGAAVDAAGKLQTVAHNSPNLRPSQHLRADPRFRRLVDRLHQLGPLGELLIEIAVAHQIEGGILDRLERMAALQPENAEVAP
jgi:hypothetical protein